ncbi:MAG: hypothetical protein H0X12_00690 [Nocardioides sp.]|nr:hypothetical protein [Nocardioides sp.]
MSKDDLGTRLSGSLHDHVDRAQTGSVTAYDVQQRAGRIRRTRWIVTVAAAAAVAAVVVPTALFVSSPGGDNSPGPVASSPSPQPTGPIDVTLTTDLQGGHEPYLDWMDPQRAVFSDGTGQPVDRLYPQFVRIGSLFLGVRSDDRGNRFLDIDTDVHSGGKAETRTIVDQVVVSRGGTTAAWTEPDGSVWTAWDGGMRQLEKQPAGVSAVAIIGEDSCADVCTVFYNAPGAGEPGLVTTDGQTERVTPRATSLDDVSSELLVAEQTSYDEGRACSEVYDLRHGKGLWETCDYTLLRFSSDGLHVLAKPSDADGIGPTSITVLSAETGTPVATYRVDDGFIGAQAWEDDGHLLFVRYSYGSGSWDIVRADLRGTVQRAAEAVNASEDRRPYTFGGNQ